MTAFSLFEIQEKWEGGDERKGEGFFVSWGVDIGDNLNKKGGYKERRKSGRWDGWLRRGACSCVV